MSTSELGQPPDVSPTHEGERQVGIYDTNDIVSYSPRIFVHPIVGAQMAIVGRRELEGGEARRIGSYLKPLNRQLVSTCESKGQLGRQSQLQAHFQTATSPTAV